MEVPVKGIPDRITIYLKQPARKEKLAWLMRHYRTKSMSDAIFKAVEEVVAKSRVERKEQLRSALLETQGCWAGDERVERALAEAEKLLGQWGIQAS
ncbi:hypothetical protein H5T52_04715 [Candidatus Bipolaricaulota bacterium]|nr:hypothetical protein [Candidatus Bipolaricaulota bacterium]